jgi:hypothetical protein
VADIAITIDILAAAANLETVAGNSDGSAMDELAARSIRERAGRLRAFGHELEIELRSAAGDRRFPSQSPVELRRLSDIAFNYLGTRDADKVAEWITLARSHAEDSAQAIEALPRFFATTLGRVRDVNGDCLDRAAVLKAIGSELSPKPGAQFATEAADDHLFVTDVANYRECADPRCWCHGDNFTRSVVGELSKNPGHSPGHATKTTEGAK